MTGPAPEQRAATFVARMRQVAGGERMRLRFDLQHRPQDGRWRPAGALGGWRTADPGVGAYVYTKRVEALAAPATYTVRIQFRWYDVDGDVQRRAERRSPVCRQPDLRPQLRVLALAPGRVTVANVGLGRAGAFTTTLGDVAVRLDAGLAAGAVAGLVVDAPPSRSHDA